MLKIDTLQQLRENRRHKLNAWLVGGNGNRWANDDGRFLKLDEFAFWPTEIQEAEKAYFAKIDEEYEFDKL